MSSDIEDSSTLSHRPSALKRWSMLSLGVFVGGGFLYLAGRNIDLDEATAAIYAVEKTWLIPVTAIIFLNLFIRSLRWSLMFPEDDRPSLRYAFDALMIGKIGNNFMPSRMGDILRATIIGRQLPQVGISGSLATVVLEKLLDSLAILIFMGIALLMVPLPPWIVRTGGIALAIFTVLLLLFLLLVNANFSAESKPGESKTLPALMNRVINFGLALLKKFSVGLYALQHARQFTVLSGLTMLIWFLEIFMYYALIQAFGIDASVLAALVCMVFLCVGLMLPAAPGYIGTYQLFIVSALQLFAVPQTTAFALAVFVNILMIVLTTTVGVLTIAWRGGLITLRRGEKAGVG